MNIIFSALLSLFMSFTVTPTDPQLVAVLEGFQQAFADQGQTVDFDGQQIIISDNIQGPLAKVESTGAITVSQLKQEMIDSWQPEGKSLFKDVMTANNCVFRFQWVGSDGYIIFFTITPDDF